MVNRRIAGMPGSVSVDDERAGRMAIEHLVGLGHRRIGYLGLSADTETARRRLSGYGSGMVSAGIRIDPRWLAAGPPTEAGGRSALRSVLHANPGNAPTAFFVASLMSALGALAGARGRGHVGPRGRVPRGLRRPPVRGAHGAALTTVRMPNLRMGQEAVRVLLEAIARLSRCVT